MSAVSASGLRVETGAWDALGADAGRVREDVFVREQRIPREMEWDEWDARSVHCVVYDGARAVATGRLLPDAHIGRMAVLAEYRRAGVGGLVLETLVGVARERGETQLALSAQAYVQRFYERHGFAVRGEHYVEAGIDHVEMVRSLRAEASFESRTVAMPDGESIFQCDWIPARPRVGALYLLHGLGEHAGRYDALARRLAGRGWHVRAHDHVGHGRSSGSRGVQRTPTQVVDHARRLLEAFARTAPGGAPVLAGHSMGGALAAELALERRAPVSALVLSSPALDLGLDAAKRALLAALGALAPSLAVPNGIDARNISHDADVVRAYESDPLVHRRICARLLRWMVDSGARSRRGASSLAVPALLLYAGDDRLVNARGSDEFARGAPAELLAAHRYEGLYHEIFNEAEPARGRVLADLEAWLDARAGAAAP